MVLVLWPDAVGGPEDGENSDTLLVGWLVYRIREATGGSYGCEGELGERVTHLLALARSPALFLGLMWGRRTYSATSGQKVVITLIGGQGCMQVSGLVGPVYVIGIICSVVGCRSFSITGSQKHS